MSGVELMKSIIQILVGGITEMAQGIGAGLSSLAPAVIHECTALRADQLAGQGIGCTGAVRSSADI